MKMMKEGVVYVGCMIIVQLAQVGQLVAGKKAILTGMTNFTFVFYSNALASLVLLPSSFFFHRSNPPPLTFSALCGCVFFGILGFLVQIVGYTGIQYASPTLATSILNLIPGFTFLLGIFFRLEKADFKSSGTQAKLIGTMVSVLGAFVVTLYQGPQLLKSPSSSSLSHLLTTPSQNWVIGGLLLGIDSVLASFLVITHALVLKKYPAQLTVSLFYSSIITILCAAVSLIVEKDTSSWSLKSNVRLMAVLYAGLFGASFQVTVSSWCLQRMGPLFVSIFYPLGIVIATVVGVIFLGDAFYLGSLVGSIVIVVGFYSVVWGNAKERKVVEGNSIKSPLLQNNTTSLVEETVVLVQ